MDALRAADAAGNAEDAQRIAGMIDAVPADDGSPAVVEPSGNWLKDNHPDIYNTGHELVTGIAKGIGDLPNLAPNVGNNVRSLYDLHFGSGTGEVKDPYQPWFNPSGPSIEELNPQTPGYEGTRQVGQMAGAAAPFGPVAMVLAPALSKGGEYLGDAADTMFQDPSQPPSHKWRQTGATVAPLLAGGPRAGLAAIERSGVLPTVSLANAAIGAVAAPKTTGVLAAVKGAAKLAEKTSRGSLARDLGDAVDIQRATLPFDHRRFN